MTMNKLDFDEMSRMAKDSPESLEAWLKAEVDQLISGAPEDHQPRLKGLQFTIDMERKKSSNPMAACIKISQMMHESFGKLREFIISIESQQVIEQPISADIIPFAKLR